MLNLYTREGSEMQGKWIKSLEMAAQCLGKTLGHAWTLHSCARLFVVKDIMPKNTYGTWSKSKLEKDSELGQAIQLHLQSIGKYVHAQHIVDYLKKEEVQEKYGLTSSILLMTARQWMHNLDYRWVKNHWGQYVDGHECKDVVDYCQNTFLPSWFAIEKQMRSWEAKPEEQKDLVEVPEKLAGEEKCVITWLHNESIFYAHDWRTSQWVKKGIAPSPYQKGEGASLMVADFVSADYGFLHSHDGKESAQVIFWPGKNQDGYFSHEDIIVQTETAIRILAHDYPDQEHIFIFGNASTHLKCADDAISARKMPKFMPKEGNNWGVEVTAPNQNGGIIHGTDRKPLKIKIRMGNGRLLDGLPQDFYYPLNHPYARKFKGMAQILAECDLGIGNPFKICAECPKFQCVGDNPLLCCCWRILYNQLDFTHVPSILKNHCSAQGWKVLFLPKFHCKLNFIKQCWGKAKYYYWMNPPSSKEEDLERNILSALNLVTINEMRKSASQFPQFYCQLIIHTDILIIHAGSWTPTGGD
jgi:hypothetical protein